MAASHELTEEDRYDTWVMRRIAGITKCCLHKHSMCIPIREYGCRTCYREDVSRMIEAQEHTRN